MTEAVTYLRNLVNATEHCADTDPAEVGIGRLRGVLAEIDRLRCALTEAVALRVSVYRNSDLEGDTNHLPDEKIAELDSCARKWAAVLEQSK